MTLPWRVFPTFLLGFLELMFFGGITFGWASLVYILKSDGYFSYLCIQNNETFNQTLPVSCDDQDANLNLVFTIAVFTFQGCMFFCGFLFDTQGTRFTRLFLHFLLVSGFLMIILSSPSSPDLLFPAMMCIATGGILFMPTNLQIGNLFGSRRSTVMTALTGAFDASSFVMLLMKLTYKSGVSLDISFSIMISASVLFFINTFIFMPVDRIPWPLPHGYGQKGYKKKKELENTKTAPNDSSQQNKQQMLNHTAKQASRMIAENCRNKDYPNLKSCIFSPAFLLITYWLSTLQLKVIYFIGTFNPFLEQITDGDEAMVSHYTEVFSFVQFGGFLIAPVSGSILDRNKALPNRRPYDDLQDNSLGFAITTSLFVVFSIFNVIPVIELQYITFILSVISRSFLYGILHASMANTFPSQYYGSLLGAVAGISALFGVLQYPLFIITQTFFDNDPFFANIFLLIVCATTSVVPTYFYFFARRMNKATEQEQSKVVPKENNVYIISNI